jgi:ATP-dependent helicase/nuclease subunit A
VTNAEVLSPRAVAEASQRAVSDPSVSAFVAASAGSGKTRLLTDRLLRLMLSGARPERILCLTFTKAAAAEMSIRLQRRLGEWVTMDGPRLETALRALDVDADIETLRRARSLFAHVLDLPGGMRIGTIHAFCQSLLRRFPLEAGVSPHFKLAEDRDVREATAEATEDLLSSLRPGGVTRELSALELALRKLSGTVTLARFVQLVTALRQHSGSVSGRAATRRAILGVNARSRSETIAMAVTWPAESSLRDAITQVARDGSPKIASNAERMLHWLDLVPEERAPRWTSWRELFLTDRGKPYAVSSLVNVALDRARPGLSSYLKSEAERVAAMEDAACTAEVAEFSEALEAFSEPLLTYLERGKQSSGVLEFGDLIAGATTLMMDPGAAWVLYKLDGGLDHLLLDEVQDTSPEQWEIAQGLCQEFFAGAGAREQRRTVFAVGDRKQSIFSFQGADVEGFEGARERLATRAKASGQIWRETPLNVSFRSTAPVLALVDAVFADPVAADGVVLSGESISHSTDRLGQAGRVELWPPTDAPTPEPPEPWSAPHRNYTATTAIEHLADQIARWTASETSGDTMLESKGRPLRPGDVMILVRRRDALPGALVNALKRLGVSVSGLDRMVLTEQPAVQDLMTLGDALLLPQDDLTFASLMTSPLGGLDDNDLMDLAINRPGPMWEALRDRNEEKPAWNRAWRFFSTLLSRVDFVSPHALFAEALTAMGGRALLLARLGREASEPIDELLNAAMSYTSKHPPSLQGFLQWLRRSGAEIRREPEAAGNQVRILTVHGAKGLQAPLVILPDTVGMPPDNDLLLWEKDPASGERVPIWVPRAEFHCERTRALRRRARRRREQEYNRQLYVALTRAEDRLVVCGAKPRRGEPGPACWYSLITRGFSRLTEITANGAVFQTFGTAASAETGFVLTADGTTQPPPPFLSWPIAPEPSRPSPLAPSRPEGVEFGPVPFSASPLAQPEHGVDRFWRGRLVHSLLQHLPTLPEAERRTAALRFVRRSPKHPTNTAFAEIVDEVMDILCHPLLAPLFGPSSRAEVPLTGVVSGIVVGGLVDRLAVLPDRIICGDFKTNWRTPASVASTPVAYVRQMAAYRGVLRAIFPTKSAICVLIWTREARISVVPDTVLDSYAPDRLPAPQA